MLYLIDTLRADRLGAYGCPGARTPALDRFARSGVQFSRAYAPSSWTRPSVASVFTGLYPSEHGAVRRENALRPGIVTLAEVLRDGGWRTAAFVSNPNVLPVFGFDRGFDTFVDLDSRRRSATAARVHAATIGYVEDTPGDEPRFLFVHTLDPHDPYEPPEPWGRLFPSGPDRAGRTLALYDAEIAAADREFGRFLRELARTGVGRGEGGAAVVVLSDHGEEFLEHGDIYHGRSLFQEQLLVPLLVHAPDPRPGRLEPRPVACRDLFATLCGIAGQPLPAGVAEASVFDPAPDPVLIAELSLDRNVVDSVLRGRYKLVDRTRPATKRGRALYDLVEDPGELRDVSGEHPEIAGELFRLLEAYRSGVHAGLFVEIVGTQDRESARRVSGRLELSGARVEHLLPSNLEDPDYVAVSEDGRRVEFDFFLEARVDPIVRSLYFPDFDRIRLITEPPGATVRVDVTMDGAPIPGVRVGGAELNWPMPLELRTDDPRLERSAAEITRPGRGAAEPFCRVYTVPEPAAEIVEIDPALDARLRALGYLD